MNRSRDRQQQLLVCRVLRSQLALIENTEERLQALNEVVGMLIDYGEAMCRRLEALEEKAADAH